MGLLGKRSSGLAGEVVKKAKNDTHLSQEYEATIDSFDVDIEILYYVPLEYAGYKPSGYTVKIGFSDDSRHQKECSYLDVETYKTDCPSTSQTHKNVYYHQPTDLYIISDTDLQLVAKNKKCFVTRLLMHVKELTYPKFLTIRKLSELCDPEYVKIMTEYFQDQSKEFGFIEAELDGLKPNQLGILLDNYWALFQAAKSGKQNLSQLKLNLVSHLFGNVSGSLRLELPECTQQEASQFQKIVQQAWLQSNILPYSARIHSFLKGPVDEAVYYMNHSKLPIRLRVAFQSDRFKIVYKMHPKSFLLRNV